MIRFRVTKPGLALCGAALVLLPGAASALEADSVLRRASIAMGAAQLKTLRYEASGMGASFGQAYKPGQHWPKLNYSSYLRRIDYETPASVEEVRRSRAEPQGGGAVPLAGEAHFGAALSGAYAWNLAGQSAAPRQAAHAARLHELWITPHGVIKAAQKRGASLAWRAQGGKDIAAVSFAEPGVFAATALINDDSLVERVESRVSDPVLGDTAVVTTYAEYRDFGPIKFPTRIRQTQGGHSVLDITVKDAQANVPLDIRVPDNVRAAGGERVVAEKAADGVWFLAGGSHNSVAIEMKDYVVLVEAPLYDGRAGAVIDEVKKLVPGKPIRYLVNSHHHFDHSGGVRTAIAEGATLVTQAQSKAWFERVLANPNRITPDRLARSGKKAKIIGVRDKHVLSDGSRTVELHHIAGSVHADTFLMAYLPREKLLVEADLYTPPPANAPAPAKPNPLSVNLVENLARLKLDVERVLPLHGRMVPAAELHRAAGKAP